MGILFSAARRFLPVPMGDELWWAAIAAQLSIGAVVIWRRTALPYATIALAGGGVMSLLMFIAATQGRTIEMLFSHRRVAGVISFAVFPVCFFIESRVHPEQWRTWRRYMEDATALDILLMRHVPDLRGDGTQKLEI